MRLRASFTAAVAGLLILGTGGCATSGNIPRAYYQSAMVNEKPVKIILDSGADTSWFTEEGAGRLGLQLTRIPGLVLNDHGVAGQTESFSALISGQRINTSTSVWMESGEPFLNRSILFLGRLLGSTWGFDGAIGWTESRQNILLLDGEKHLISALATVPEEASDWLKLRIRNTEEQFYLEVPLDGGETARILVDTGSPGGFVLPGPAWDEWRRANPRARTNRGFGFAPGVDFGSTVHAYAEAAVLGPLRLTSVEIEEPRARDRAKMRGMIGLKALSRMKMIVDAGAGFAYIHPLPPAQPKPPSMLDWSAIPVVQGADADWKIDGSVEVDQPALRANAANYEGRILRSNGDKNAALAKFNEIVDLKPDWASGYVALANAFDGENRSQLAIDELTRAIQRHPDQKQGLNMRGVMYLDTSNWDAAISDLDKAIELDSSYGAAYFNRAMAWLNKGNATVALQNLDVAIASSGGWAAAYAGRASARLDLGQIEAAIEDLNAAIREEPRNAEFYAERGRLRLRIGQYDGAYEDAEQALDLDAKLSFGYSLRGSANSVRGNFAAAIADYDKVIKLDPDTTGYPRIYRELLLRRLKRNADGTAFVTDGPAWKTPWTKRLGEFIAGKIQESELIAAITSPGPIQVPVRRCEAFYAIGMIRLLAGDIPGARENFALCISTNARTTGMLQFAKTELARLDRKL